MEDWSPNWHLSIAVGERPSLFSFDDFLYTLVQKLSGISLAITLVTSGPETPDGESTREKVPSPWLIRALTIPGSALAVIRSILPSWLKSPAAIDCGAAATGWSVCA
jgi:hypothetical protein